MIDGIPISDYGPGSLVTILVILIAIGQLIPRWTHKERMRDRDTQIAKLEAALDKRDEQFDRLFVQGTLTIKLLEDIKATGDGKQGSRQST